MSDSLLSTAEARRAKVIRDIPRDSRAANGQFLTPASVAEFMALMFSPPPSGPIALLDPGAGAGALSLALIDVLSTRVNPPPLIHLIAVESDPYLASLLQQTVRDHLDTDPAARSQLHVSILQSDFIEYGTGQLVPRLHAQASSPTRFTHAILNPPYRKLSPSSSQHRRLASIGLHTPNMYAAFVALTLALLHDEGELVAITPRSFCNGPYFRRFRRFLHTTAAFQRIHVFHSRESAFQEDRVLQENIIFHLKKTPLKGPVRISSSPDRTFAAISERTIPHEVLVNPSDPDLIIRIPTNDFDAHVLERLSCFQCRLHHLGLTVSTGPVVDFRLAEFLLSDITEDSAPLVYPAHIEGNSVTWPRQRSRKPNAIRVNPTTRKWLLPNGYYALIRRFSSKEERRRIYPALFSPLISHNGLVGFENHLNVIHRHGSELQPEIAKGLVAYFTSTILDLYFRQFSGHTQVNANDIHALPLPPTEVLLSLSALYTDTHTPTEAVDIFLEDLFKSTYNITSPDPTTRP